MTKKKTDVTLHFACVHLPFEHRNFFDFLHNTYKKWGCNKVVCEGDLIDHHLLSEHVKETDAKSLVDEQKLVLTKVKKLAKIFPKMEFILGNHDIRPYRLAKKMGIPETYMKLLKDIYGFSKRWNIHKDSFIKNDIFHTHQAGSGENAAFNLARRIGMNVVAAHTHSKAGVKWFATPKNKFFGLQTGCLVDKKAYAMRYCKNFEPILGCGVTIGNKEAYSITMDL